jgi:hypothetical protein
VAQIFQKARQGSSDNIDITRIVMPESMFFPRNELRLEQVFQVG